MPLKDTLAIGFPRALSTHDIGLRDVVEGLQVLGKLPRLYLFAVSIADLQPMQDYLSEEVATVLPELKKQGWRCWRRLRLVWPKKAFAIEMNHMRRGIGNPYLCLPGDIS